MDILEDKLDVNNRIFNQAIHIYNKYSDFLFLPFLDDLYQKEELSDLSTLEKRKIRQTFTVYLSENDWSITNFLNRFHHIPSKIISNEDEDFFYRGVGKVVLKNSVESLEEKAFSYANLIYTLALDETRITYLPPSFMEYSSMSVLLLPKTLDPYNGFSEGAFRNAINLEVIRGSVPMTRLPKHCFANCEKLTTLNFPLTEIREIEEEAFLDCNSLETIDFRGTRLKKIHAKAFHHCHFLKHVLLNRDVEIDPTAFEDCISLDKIEQY